MDKKILYVLNLVAACSLLFSVGKPPTHAAPKQQETPFDRAPRTAYYTGPENLPRLDDPNLKEPILTAPNVSVPWSKIVFQSYRDGNWEIYLAEGDGSGQTRLTWDGASDIHPRLNRGSTRIVFTSNRENDFELYSMNLDGSGLTQLTDNGDDEVNPVWSPDGTRIAFQSYRDDDQSEIYVMNADGTGQTRLTWDGEYDADPAWSPDGSKIAFSSYRAGNGGIWVMNADGSGLAQLAGQSYSQNPAWSPDGTQIAYDADNDGDGWQELMLMNADGTNQHQVYNPSGSQTDAWVRSWSPDGRYVAFTRISFVYYEGYWYWTYAYLYYYDITNSQTGTILSGDTEWKPDWQTTDGGVPVSSMNLLPAQSPAEIPVSWSGYDNGPSGLKNYDVQVRDGAAGDWTDWQMATTATSGFYTGVGGHTYHFRARARDNGGNVEAWPGEYDVATMVESMAPHSAVEPLPGYLRNGEVVQWGGRDPGGSGIQTYDVQYRDTAGGDWVAWQTGTVGTSAAFTGVAGHTYSFRARAMDKAQNVEDWPAGDGDTQTTLYQWVIAGTVRDNLDTPIEGVTVTVNPGGLDTFLSDTDGHYSAYGANQSAYGTAWAKTGYNPLPVTTFDGDQDATFDLNLPPGDNQLNDWGFESGDWGNEGWLASGGIPPAIVNYERHTGFNAARFGIQGGFLSPETVTNIPAIYQDLVLAVGNDQVHLLWDQDYGQGIFTSSRSEDDVWSPPKQLSLETEMTSSPHLFLDPYGYLHAYWRENDSLYYTRRDIEGNWSEPQPIAPISTGWLDIDMDRNGISHILFASYGLSTNYLSYMQCNKDGICTSITQIDPHDFIMYLNVIAEDSGAVHAVWRDEYNNVIHIRRDVEGNWSQTIIVSSGNRSTLSSEPEILLDSSNQLHVAWLEEHDSNISLYHNWLDQNGYWHLPEIVTSVGKVIYPRMASTSDNLLYLTWFENFEILYTFRNLEGLWLEPVNLSNTPSSSYGPVLLIGNDGRFHLTWEEKNGSESTEIWYITKRGDNLWSKPVVLSNEGISSRNHVMALDLSEVIHVAWSGDKTAYTKQMTSEQDAVSNIYQSATVPESLTNPTLSFFYRLEGASAISDMALSVQVSDSVTTATVFSTTTDILNWTHCHLDFSPWAGKTITLTLGTQQAAGVPYITAYLDEVTLGSAHPDVWVDIQGQPGAALPGEPVVYTLTYGNRGGADADSVVINETLPAGLTFVSASVPPTITGSALTWEVGNLEAGSGPFTITVTAAVDASAAPGSYLTSDLTIATTTAELETANNVAQTSTFVGAMMYLPMVMNEH